MAAIKRKGFLLYLAPELHQQLKEQSRAEGISMTKIATAAIEQDLGKRKANGKPDVES